MWLHATSELAGVDPIIVFCFELTRETEHLRKYYNDFRGYITCDAYCSYQVLAKEKEGVILICGCKDSLAVNTVLQQAQSNRKPSLQEYLLTKYLYYLTMPIPFNEYPHFLTQTAKPFNESPTV